MKKTLYTLSLIAGIACAQAQKPGIQLSYIDSSASPRNDFYTFCNGKWVKNFKLPESDSRYGSFNEINENNLKNIRNIYLESSKNKTAKPGSNEQKLRDFYTVAMDSVKADKLGLKPIMPLLQQINGVASKEDLIKLKSRIEPLGVRLFYAVGSEADLKNSQRNMLYLSQAGYGLPDKDFYFNAQFSKITEKYKEYIASVLELAGEKKEKVKE